MIDRYLAGVSVCRAGFRRRFGAEVLHQRRPWRRAVSPRRQRSVGPAQELCGLTWRRVGRRAGVAGASRFRIRESLAENFRLLQERRLLAINLLR